MTASRIRTVSAVALAAILSLGLARAGFAAGDGEKDTVEALTSRFLRAFENLDITAFMLCFAADATVFFSVPEPPQRFDGKAAIQTHFEQVFAAIRKSSSSNAPPYHRLIPEDLLIQSIGPDAAIVSFHLRNTERIARRTLVVRRVQGVWLIAHLHASNVPRERQPAK